MIKKNRVEALTDGVLAIVVTIMVLELTIPSGTNISDLLSQWPIFLSFVISFFHIYISWYNHNKLFGKINCIGRHVFILNGFWLLFGCLVPFTTRWLGENSTSTVPMLVYLTNLLLWTLSFQLLDHVILKENPGVEKDEITDIVLRAILYTGILIAAIVAIFFPQISLFIILIYVSTSVIVLFTKASTKDDKACGCNKK